MKARTFIVIMLFCLSCVCQIMGAPHDNVRRIQRIAVDLPDNTVKCIARDKYGFLWLGTFNGLCRYDGRNTEVFRRDPSDDGGIPGNSISAISVTDRRIWVATDYGLCSYDLERPHFRKEILKLPGKPGAISVSGVVSLAAVCEKIYAVDSDGRLFAGKDDGRAFRPLYPELHDRWSFVSPYKETLFIAATRAGLYVIDSRTDRIVAAHDFPIGPEVDNSVYFSANTDLIYVAFGLYRDPLVFSFDDERGLSLHPADLPSDLKVICDYKDGLAAGTDGQGLWLIDRLGHTRLTPDNSGLGSDAVFSLLTDNDSTLWIGSYRGGLSSTSDYIDSYRSFTVDNGMLTHRMATAIAVADGKMYVGLDGGGLNVYDPVTGDTRAYATSNSAIAGDNVVSMCYDGQYIWLGCYNAGLCRFNPHDGSFRTFRIPGSHNNIWEIQKAHDGELWVLAEGLYIFDSKASQFIPLEFGRQYNVTSMAMDGSTAWLLTDSKGVIKVDCKTRKMVGRVFHGMEADAGAQSIYADADHALWYYGEHTGLWRLDPSKGCAMRYMESDALRDRVVTGMIGQEGNIWLATGNGLFRLDTVSRIMSPVTIHDMLSPQFNHNACLADGDRLYFGTIKGVVGFDATRICVSRQSHGVYFTGMDIISGHGGNIALFGRNPERVDLDADQNFFRIHFAAPEYFGDGNARIQVRMVNLDNDWQDVADTRYLTYTDVSPGEYFFKIRMQRTDGGWDEDMASLHIVVAAPWWRTWWAMTLWIFIAVSIVLVIARLYYNTVRHRHAAQLKEIEKNASKAVSEAKLNFYTNITHELRTPIFLIGALAEQMQDSAGMRSKNVAAIRRNVRRLDRLVSRIIDFRKMESGKLELHCSRFDASALCRSLSPDYEALCSRKEIEFSCKVPGGCLPVCADLEKMELILTNLVSNAFKYTGDGGRVTLSVEKVDNMVVFSVEDTGIGIREEDRDLIFGQFCRAKNGDAASGDGIGLSFVKVLVELHGGQLELQSAPGKGSRFSFSLPCVGVGDDSESFAAIPVELKADGGIVSESVESIQSPAAGRSILIVDDEAQATDLLGQYLSDTFKVMKAADGFDALALAREMLPDIVICDIMMPKMTGMEFLEEIKGDKRTAHIPVVMFSAKAMEEDKLAAFNAGAAEYLTKPVSLKFLRSRIMHVLEQTEAYDREPLIAKEERKISKADQAFLLACRGVVDDNITDAGFSVVAMAEALGMSHSALYKKIKSITGLSVMDFITDYRVFRAMRMIHDGEANVGIVMERCGFKDARAFREAFRKKTGMTPKAYIGTRREPSETGI